MKIGVMVRANRKGLGYQTRDFAFHMPADSALLVKLPPDPAFPDDDSLLTGIRDVWVAQFGEHRDTDQEQLIRDWLAHVDVVFTAETLYDWRIADWARQTRTRTVVQGNPEFYVHGLRDDLPHPDRWVWPTSWMVENLPGRQRVLPCPVPWVADLAAPADDGPLRVLHVAGHAAAGDRNGTLDFMESIRRIQSEVIVTVVGQDGWFPEAKPRKNVELRLVPFGVEDRTELYAGHHLCVLPRRYGGNCLPANEACASGLAVAMTNIAPNPASWPIIPLDSRPARLQRTPYGPIPTRMVRPEHIAATIDRYANNRVILARCMEASRAWAERHTWDALRSAYVSALSP